MRRDYTVQRSAGAREGAHVHRTAMAASRYPPLQLVGALSDSRWRRRQSRRASSAPTTRILVPEIRKARRHGAQDKLDIRNC